MPPRAVNALCLLFCLHGVGFSIGSQLDNWVDHHLSNVFQIVKNGIHLRSAHVSFDVTVYQHTLKLYRIDDPRLPWSVHLGQLLITNGLNWLATYRRDIRQQVRQDFEQLLAQIGHDRVGAADATCLVQQLRANFAQTLDQHRRMCDESDQFSIQYRDNDLEKWISINAEAIERVSDPDYDSIGVETRFEESRKDVLRNGQIGQATFDQRLDALAQEYAANVRQIVSEITDNGF